MRIIAGKYKGREFSSPHSHKTHPMSEKVRGALFNILGDIEGLSFLDAFAGSGALAYEAASRGAAKVVAVEKDRAAFNVIEQNIEQLRAGKVIHATRAHLSGWSSRHIEKDKYDVILLDPSYDDLQPLLLNKVVKRHLKPGGLAVLSYPGDEKELPALYQCEIVEQKNYGDAQLVFYRKNK
jgi:16S rRNA (guanine966-N2)-methyltransferase